MIDCHTHYYPEEIHNNPAAWAKQMGEPYWAELMTPEAGKKRTLQDFASTERFIADMQQANVEKVILQGWYWERQATCRWHNDAQAAAIRKHPDHFAAFASIQPLEPQCLDDLQRAVDGGHCGIGEIFPAVQGFAMDHPSWLKAIAFATEHKMPITLHVTDPNSSNYKGRVVGHVEDYLWLIEEFPETTFILAHLGGFLHRRFDLNQKNVYFDLAAAPLLYDTTTIIAAIKELGPSKVLYGSDYPLRIFPKHKKHAEMVQFIQLLKESSLSESELAAIFSDNIKSILPSC